MLAAQDFKRAGDGDQGPNTGGMGAYIPLPWAPPGLAGEVMATVIQPAIDELRRRGTPYRGLLYAGLSLTSAGVRVVEFNARFGDPETQVVLDRLATPLAGLLAAAASGSLAGALALRWADGAAVTVVIAAEGYPAQPAAGRHDRGTGRGRPSRARTCCTLARRSTGGSPACHPAAGCSTWSAPARTWRPPGRRRTRPRALPLRGGWYRPDIAEQAALEQQAGAGPPGGTGRPGAAPAGGFRGGP